MTEQDKLEELLAREAIRELVLLYSRGVDRKDPELLRTLYTEDATDTHGDTYDGPAGAYVDFLETAFPYMRYSGHHVCNHLISVDGDEGEGEVYALAYHIIPDGEGGWLEDFMCVRYLDRYRLEADGRWRFARRIVTYDLQSRKPAQAPGPAADDAASRGHAEFAHRVFARGPRA